MQDVANAAGVSLGTVSNVLNHPEKVSPATARRVRAAIDGLGFVRNDAARSLASGSNKSVGMVLADIENSLFIDMAHGAQEAARAAGLNLLLANAACDMTLQDEYLDLFDQARVTGVLLAPMEDSTAGIARMRSHGRQIVLLNYAPGPATCCSVLVNNEQVGYLAARHLIDDRAHAGWPIVAATRTTSRSATGGGASARRSTRRAAGVTLEEIDSAGLTTPHGHRVGRARAGAARASVPDGLVVVTDQLANRHHPRAAHGRRGSGCPATSAVVGCENNRAAGPAAVPLTAVDAAGTDDGPGGDAAAHRRGDLGPAPPARDGGAGARAGRPRQRAARHRAISPLRADPARSEAQARRLAATLRTHP